LNKGFAEESSGIVIIKKTIVTISDGIYFLTKPALLDPLNALRE
jgi:hypothetical protein